MEGMGNTTWPNKHVYRENMKANNNIARQIDEPKPDCRYQVNTYRQVMTTSFQNFPLNQIKYCP